MADAAAEVKAVAQDREDALELAKLMGERVYLMDRLDGTEKRIQELTAKVESRWAARFVGVDAGVAALERGEAS